jgi:hypothetical protein
LALALAPRRQPFPDDVRHRDKDTHRLEGEKGMDATTARQFA